MDAEGFGEAGVQEGEGVEFSEAWKVLLDGGGVWRVGWGGREGAEFGS